MPERTEHVTRILQAVRDGDSKASAELLPLVYNELRELAQQHPRVLPEPKPTSWLMAFGASSIDFELRVFVAEIRDRLPVSTELATQIHRRFRSEGIEIPFPQVDLHVRTPPPPPKREGEGTAPASS